MDRRTDRQTDGRMSFNVPRFRERRGQKYKIGRGLEYLLMLLPVKFLQIPFSGCRREIEIVSANQKQGWPSLFSDWSEKHKLCRGHGVLSSYKVLSNSVQWFLRREVNKRRTDNGRTTDNATIVHVIPRMRSELQFWWDRRDQRVAGVT